MKKIHFGLVVFGVLALTTTAFATTDKSNTTITRIEVTTTQVLIQLASGTSGESCTDNSWALVNTSDATHEQMYSLILSAYLSGSQVDVRLSGCNYYPKVNFVKAE